MRPHFLGGTIFENDGGIEMTTTNHSNIIQNIHRFIDSNKGENY
jgi:hypothetical protein